MKYLYLPIIALLAPTLVCADVTISMTADGQADSNSVLSVRDGHTRMEQASDEAGSILYDTGSGSLTVLNHRDKSYMVMDESTMEGMADTMNSAMQQMQKQLANMPEEQRRMMMERMPEMMQKPSSAPKDKYSVSKSGGDSSVAGIKCHNVTVLKNGDPEGTSCIASPSAMKISKGDFATIVAMFTRLQNMAERFSSDEDNMPDLVALGGFPLRMAGPDGTNTSEVTAVEHGELDKMLFSVPEGYREQAMPGLER